MGTRGLLGHRYGREGRPGCWSLAKKGGRGMRQEGKAEARFPAPDLPEPELLYAGISTGKYVSTHFVNQTEWINGWQ